MARTAKIPISLKLNVLALCIVSFSTVTYFILAVKTFREDKKELVYELTHNGVKTLASELTYWIQAQEEKAKWILANPEHPDFKSGLERDPNLVSLQLFEEGEGEVLKSLFSQGPVPTYLLAHGIGESDWQKKHRSQLEARIQAQMPQLLKRGRLFLNVSFNGGDQDIYLGALVLLDSQGPKKKILVMELDPQRIGRSIQETSSIMKSVILDSSGWVIAGETSKEVMQTTTWSRFPELIEDLQKNQLLGTLSVATREFNQNDQSYLAGLTSPMEGLFSVVSWVPSSIAFSAAERFVKQTGLFAGFVVFLALFLGIQFSKTLTRPLLKLVDATSRFSQGEQVETVHLKSNDEIGVLATAFNSMTSRLLVQRKALEQQNQELEIKVRERTFELESEKRRAAEANDALLKTTRLAALGELAGVTAHEILNPINNMNIRLEKDRALTDKREQEDITLVREILHGWTEALGARDWNKFQKELSKSVDGGKVLVEEDLANLNLVLQDQEKRFLDRQKDQDFLRRELSRVTKIINGMRGLSRVGGEKSHLDVHLAIDDAAATMSDLFSKKKIEFVKNYSGDSRDQFMLLGQKEELVQVFSNLLRNSFQAVIEAKKESEHRAPKLEISTMRGKEGRIEIRFKDNGTGISPENISKLFETQFTTKTAQDGTGLGLSISRRIVRSFDGDIELEQTQAGVGTTFLVWMPAASTKVQETRDT